MRTVAGTLVVAVVACLSIGPLAAQAPPGKGAAAPTPSPQPTPAEAPPPYEPQLLRLAELMGALSYLRDLCRAGDGAEFHDRMARLLEAEGSTEQRKETLAGAFNRGFGDYELTYRACTPAAREVIAHYLEESAAIARDLTSRYGG